MSTVAALCIGGPEAGKTREIDDRERWIDVPDFPDLPRSAFEPTIDPNRYRYRRIELAGTTFLVPDDDEDLLAEFNIGVGNPSLNRVLAAEIAHRGKA